MEIGAFVQTSNRNRVEHRGPIAANVQCARIKGRGNVHKIFMFLCPLHPIMDYKICFTFNNVSELHRCRRENFVSPFVKRFSATQSSRTFSISCSDKFQLALH